MRTQLQFKNEYQSFACGWEIDYSNIALVETNIGLMGNHHIYHTWITNFKRIRQRQNTFNLIFL